MNKTLLPSFALGALLFFVSAGVALAQTALSVSITPPLFQLTIGPGESWSSSIKVVNNNASAVTYYAQAVDFEPKGENGNGDFIPLVNEQSDPARSQYSVASWLQLPESSVTIPAGQSADIPFTVSIPQQVEPGGHYGAILIGTEPGALTPQGALVKVSSFVSSLLFVKIKGDVDESGRIREFYSTKELYDSPSADFVLRFENTGNTHVKPEGDITIYNMWGKERGKVSINQDTGNFGNVLPKSIRRFQFGWQGEDSVFDIGRYSAVVTLAYGEDGKKNVSATTYFWVVPVVPVATTLALLVFFIALMTWFIRRYIRRALSLERQRLGVAPEIAAVARMTSPHPSPKVEYSAQTLMEPLIEGVIDLRKMAGKPSAPAPATEPSRMEVRQISAALLQRPTFFDLLSKYRLFLLFIASLVASILCLSLYFNKVLVPQRHFEIRDVKIQEETPAQ